MAVGLVLLVAPVVLLVVGAVGLLVWGVVTLRGEVRAPGILRVVAGVGVLAAAALAASVLISDLPYSIAILPIVALAGGIAWAAVFVVAAAMSGRSSRVR